MADCQAGHGRFFRRRQALPSWRPVRTRPPPDATAPVQLAQATRSRSPPAAALSAGAGAGSSRRRVEVHLGVDPPPEPLLVLPPAEVGIGEQVLGHPGRREHHRQREHQAEGAGPRGHRPPDCPDARRRALPPVLPATTSRGTWPRAALARLRLRAVATRQPSMATLSTSQPSPGRGGHRRSPREDAEGGCRRRRRG